MRELRSKWVCQLSSLDCFIYLVGAGLADPDGVRVEPFVFVADAEPTESRDGLDGVIDVVTRRVGILVCVPSSNEKFMQSWVILHLLFIANDSPLLLRDKFDPCLEPLWLNGLEFGLELPREPPGVIPVLRRRGNDEMSALK